LYLHLKRGRIDALSDQNEVGTMTSGEKEIRLRLNLESVEDARAIAAEVEQQGGTAEVTEEKGILPLAVLLVVVMPPGISLLALVVNRIVHSWTDHGVVIDARGTGDPTIIKENSLPFGTVVILTRDGESSKRTDLPEIDLSKYIEAAVKAVSGGASATAAKAIAEDDLTR
jgi:hypothetical protein